MKRYWYEKGKPNRETWNYTNSESCKGLEKEDRCD